MLNSHNTHNTHNNQEDDFWNDNLDMEGRIINNYTTLTKEIKASNPKRLLKFLTFYNQYQDKEKSKQPPQPPKKIITNIQKTIVQFKGKKEKNQRIHADYLKKKETEEIKECTFKPQINKFYKESIERETIQSTLQKSTKTNQPTSFYDKSQQWANKIKCKKAKKRQEKEMNCEEYTFMPNISDLNSDEVFNNIMPFDYKNVNFMRTYEVNKRKRINDTANTNRTSLTPVKRIEMNTMNYNNMFTLKDSIESLRNELMDFNEEDDISKSDYERK